MEYDSGIPEGAEESIQALFNRDVLLVEKKGKNGFVEQDILPMIRELTVSRLDGWDEHFNYSIWLKAFETCKVDPNDYTIRGYGEDEVLPRDTIDVGVSKKFLQRERQRAYAGDITPDCRQGCAGCGANKLLKEVECDA